MTSAARPRLPALALLVAPACLPPAQLETPAVTAEATPAPTTTQPPRYARVSAPLTLHADPSTSAQHLKLTSGSDTATPRIVEILEQREGWSRVRTVLPRQARALGFDASMGLAILDLEGWVRSAELLELRAQESSPGQGPADEVAAPLDASSRLVAQVNLPAGVTLRWPDGRVAGRVAEAHHFYTPATTRTSETPEGKLELHCHERRSAPGLGVVEGWLCTEAAELGETGVATGVPVEQPQTFVAGEPGEGALDRDIIRRIVRAHLAEVRACYNAGLSVDPQLTGRVAINFVISGDGTVSSAVVAQDDLPDPTVGQCIAKAVTTWRFPKPRGGGNVVVTYPFNLTPG